MKVAIDSGALSSGHKVRGIGVNTDELITSLTALVEGRKDVEIEAVDFKSTDLSKYDVVHYQYFRPFFIDLPLKKPAKKVVLTIHDLIPLLYPKHYPSGIKGKIRFKLNKFLVKKNVDLIITISEISKKDICKYLGVDPNKVKVIYLAPKSIYRHIAERLEKIREKYNLPNKFVLYVGDVNYNKNIPVLLEACRIAAIPLVICGKQAEKITDSDLNHPELHHLRGLDWSNVITPGFVPDEDLVKIYNLASVYVQPSLSEGFGLPILEAFACETPVVAAKTSALLEIGQAGALFAAPNDPNDFAEKIKQVIKDKGLRNQLIETAKVVVKNYTWEKTAKETLKVYESL